MKRTFISIYHLLLGKFGAQHWWPGDTAFEIMLGAILTQNTNWTNVEKAIRNLKASGLLEFNRMRKAPDGIIRKCIRPTGYFNQKTKKVRNFLNFLNKECHGDLERLKRIKTPELRERLLSINGIGPETADSILLYALNKRIFVVDAYTRRIFSRHGLIHENADYHAIQHTITAHFPENIRTYNEFHALIVKLGKDFCRKSKPLCSLCPLAEDLII